MKIAARVDRWLAGELNFTSKDRSPDLENQPVRELDSDEAEPVSSAFSLLLLLPHGLRPKHRLPLYRVRPLN